MEKKIYFTQIRRFVSFLELQKHNFIVTINITYLDHNILLLSIFKVVYGQLF